MNSGIYKITNKIDNKCYIGQSTNLKSRIKSHKSMLKHNNERNILLKRATEKYGYKNFEIEIIKYCIEEELDYYELYFIQYYSSYKRNKGYNIELGGNQNKHLSKKQIEKMRNTKKGKLMGKENPFYGRKHTEESKKKISEANKGNKGCLGRFMSEETRRKIGEANKWNRIKTVNCYTLDNIFLKTYPSVAEAARQLNVKSSSLIAQCSRGKRKSAYGYKWKYAEVKKC